MSRKGLYTPRLADEHIRKLYWIAKRQRLKMTQLLNLIVAVAIEELEHAPDICDEAPAQDVVAQGTEGRVHQRGASEHGYPRGTQPKNHDRPTVRHAAHVCEYSKRHKV